MKKIVYHSTLSQIIPSTENILGVHFGDKKTAMERFRQKLQGELIFTKKRVVGFISIPEKGWLYKVEINLNNPLKMIDNPLAFENPQIFSRQLVNMKLISPVEFKQEFQYKSMDGIKKYLQSIGYDGIVYKNLGEGTKTNSYLVFENKDIRIISKEQIKITTKSRDA